MPRPNHVDPIKLGGHPVQHLGADPPEIAEGTAIDWEPVFKASAFTPDEVQFLLLHRVGEIPATDVAAGLGWDSRRLDAVRKRADRRVERLKNCLRGLIDYENGNSRRLSFQRKSPGGVGCWNLKELGSDFDSTMAGEHEFIKEISPPCLKPDDLAGRYRR